MTGPEHGGMIRWLYDKNQSKENCSLLFFEISSCFLKTWHWPEQTDGSSLLLYVGELIRNVFHMSPALIVVEYFPLILNVLVARSVKPVHLCADVYVWFLFALASPFGGSKPRVPLCFIMKQVRRSNPGCNQESHSASPMRLKGNTSIKAFSYDVGHKNNSFLYPNLTLFIFHLLFLLEEILWGQGAPTTTLSVFMDNSLWWICFWRKRSR